MNFADPYHQRDFSLICEFYKDRGCTSDPVELCRKFTNSVNKGTKPTPTKQKSQVIDIDPMVVSGLQRRTGNTYEDCVQMILVSLEVGKVEQDTGHLLEEYIHSKTKDDGWVWCQGNVIRGTDFIKKTPHGWLQLQIKNSWRTENSSASSVRNGTDIMKWHRRLPNGKTNWEELSFLMGKDYGMHEQGLLEHTMQIASASATLPTIPQKVSLFD